MADVLARSIEQLSAGSLPVVVVVFAVTTTIMTNLITNAAAASILTPVALGIATKLELDPVTLLALVATCISFTFINPFSHQTNLMVMGPGAYSTRTFAEFGAPLVAVSLAIVSVVTWALLRPGWLIAAEPSSVVRDLPEQGGLFERNVCRAQSAGPWANGQVWPWQAGPLAAVADSGVATAVRSPGPSGPNMPFWASFGVVCSERK